MTAEKAVPYIGCIGVPGAPISQTCFVCFFVIALLHSAKVLVVALSGVTAGGHMQG